VARHRENNCSNPIARIDEVPLQSYVAGVVHGEIGIFRAAGTGEGVAIAPQEVDARVTASFQTFAIAARTYAIWWYLRRGADADFHIHDGPCNQVYQDARDSVSERAAATTIGKILVPRDDPNSIDKHEYASSCARNGTLPSYRNARDVRRDDIVPDLGLQRVCVRSWCGHDRLRMAHQDNPFLPSGNRCLVRGICQWGSLERSVRGDSFEAILQHYQPDLLILDPQQEADPGTVRGSVIDLHGEPIAGAQLRFRQAGQSGAVSADGEGSYTLELAAGSWDAEVSAVGFHTTQERLRVISGQTIWQHFALRPNAGEVVIDAGASADADSKIATSDATMSDAAQSPDAALEPLPDAGADSARPPPGAAPPNGCSCATAAPQFAAWLLLLSLGLRRRRRVIVP
jgi:uncharacterized protein (TIGR03382 family)